MIIRWIVVVAAATLMLTVSCGPRATPEECAGACRKYVSLMQTPGGEGKIAALEAIDREIRRLEKALERDLNALDQQLEKRLDLAMEDDERTKMIEEYEDLSEAKQEEYQPLFEALVEAKALGGSGGIDATKALDGCIDGCLEGRTSKSSAVCQAQAASLAEFQTCK